MSVDICQINQVLPIGVIIFGKYMFMYLASDYQRVHVYVNLVCWKHELLGPYNITYIFGISSRFLSPADFVLKLTSRNLSRISSEC